MEKVKRESEEAIAREREKRKESEYDRTVEIANYCEANDRLQDTVIGLIEKTGLRNRASGKRSTGEESPRNRQNRERETGCAGGRKCKETKTHG